MEYHKRILNMEAEGSGEEGAAGNIHGIGGGGQVKIVNKKQV